MAATMAEVKEEVQKMLNAMRKEIIDELVKSRIEPMERQLLEQMRQHEEGIKETKENWRKKEANDNKPKIKWGGEKNEVFTDLLMDMQVWAGSMNDDLWETMLIVESSAEEITEDLLNMNKRE